MRVLIIEDDLATTRGLDVMLKAEGFSVHATDLGADGIELARLYDYDIIVLDLMLPDMNGFTVLDALRSAKIHTPVIVVSGDAAVSSRTRALGLGADDFLVKPFQKAELVARLRAIVRRSQSHSRSKITTGKLTIDLDEKSAEANGSRIALTVKEYDTLEALCLRKGATMTKDALLGQLYRGMDEPEQKIIDVFICKLRKKIAAATGGENYIKTVWGRGYELHDPAQAA